MKGRAIILSKDVVLENNNNNSRDPSSTVLNKDQLKSDAMTLTCTQPRIMSDHLSKMWYITLKISELKRAKQNIQCIRQFSDFKLKTVPFYCALNVKKK